MKAVDVYAQKQIQLDITSAVVNVRQSYCYRLDVCPSVYLPTRISQVQFSVLAAVVAFFFKKMLQFLLFYASSIL